MLNFDNTILPSSLPSEDRQQLLYLLVRCPLIRNALVERGHELDTGQVSEIEASLHANNGMNRQVFRIKIKLHGGEQEELALKLARRVDITCQDHAVMSYYTNLKLGRDTGSLYQFEDGRLVSVGVFHPGQRGDEAYRDSPTSTMRAIIRESISVWKSLGGFFIPEPKGDQFLVVQYDNYAHANLIDKGDFHKLINQPYSLERCPDTWQLQVNSHVGDLSNFSRWLKPMGIEDVVSRVVSQLGIDTFSNLMSDPDNAMLASVGLFDPKPPIETKGIVLGVLDSLGLVEGGDFVKSFATNLRSGEITLIDGENSQIAEDLLCALESAVAGISTL